MVDVVKRNLHHASLNVFMVMVGLNLIVCVFVYSSASVIVVDLGGLEITSSSKEFVVRLCNVYHLLDIIYCGRANFHKYYIIGNFCGRK